MVCPLMTQLRQFTSFRRRQMTHCGIDSLLERLPVGAFTHWKAPPLHGSSLRLDACRFDHLAPLLGFVGEELAEFGRRLRRRYDAEVGQLGLNPRICLLYTS